MNARRVRSAVKRSAWLIAPRRTSSYAGESGQDRQARGVRATSSRGAQLVGAQVEDRAAPGAASARRRRPDGRRRARRGGSASRSTIRTWRSPSRRARPRSAALRGIGYGPGSDSSAYSKLTGTRRWSAADHRVRDADRATLVQARAEVGVQRVVEADRFDERLGVARPRAGGRRAGSRRWSSGRSGSPAHWAAGGRWWPGRRRRAPRRRARRGRTGMARRVRSRPHVRRHARRHHAAALLGLPRHRPGRSRVWAARTTP